MRKVPILNAVLYCFCEKDHKLGDFALPMVSYLRCSAVPDVRVNFSDLRWSAAPITLLQIVFSGVWGEGGGGESLVMGALMQQLSGGKMLLLQGKSLVFSTLFYYLFGGKVSDLGGCAASIVFRLVSDNL